MKRIFCLFLSFVMFASLIGCKQKVKSGIQPDGSILVKVIKCGVRDTSTENAKVYKKIQDDFFKYSGIKIQFDITIIDWMDTLTEYNRLLSSGEEYDVGQMHTGVLDGYTKNKNNGFRDIDGYINDYLPNLKKIVPQTSFDMQVRNNKTMALPADGYNAMYWFCGRKDIFDQYGLAMPKTVIEFENIMKTLKEQDPKCIPLVGANFAIERVIMALCELPENYRQSYFLDVDGKVKPLIFHKNFGQYIETYNKWIKNGWISSDILNTDAETADSLFQAGKGYIKADFVNNPLDNDQRILQKQNINANVDMLPIFEGYYGNSMVHYELAGNIDWVFPKCANEDALKAFLKYYDWQCSSKEAYRLTTFGIEGEHWVINSEGKMEPTEAYKDLPTSESPYMSLYGFFTTVNSEFSLYSSKTSNEVIEAVEKLQKSEKTECILQPLSFDYSKITLTEANAMNSVLETVSDGMVGNLTANDAWNKVKQSFMENDGQEVIDELTKQYNEKYKK